MGLKRARRLARTRAGVRKAAGALLIVGDGAEQAAGSEALRAFCWAAAFGRKAAGAGKEEAREALLLIVGGAGEGAFCWAAAFEGEPASAGWAGAFCGSAAGGREGEEGEVMGAGVRGERRTHYQKKR
jgi:hypothetical protein